MIAAARMDIATAIKAPRGVEAVLRAIDHTWQANPHRARFVRELAGIPSAELANQLEPDPSPAGHHPTWSWRAREAIAQALERKHDPDALHALGRLVLEDDDDVRRADRTCRARARPDHGPPGRGSAGRARPLRRPPASRSR